MRKDKKGAKHTGKYVSAIIFSNLIIIVLLLLIGFFSWLFTDILGETNDFASTLYVIQSAYAVILLAAIPICIYFYRKKQKEIKTLTDAISRVAEGDYSSKIEPEKNTNLLPVYEDFNKMCAELESVTILRNDFINNYSHEFKTPIASINGFASLLLEKELSFEEQRQYLEIIVDESARLSRLAHNTILLSKLTAQQIVTEAEEYDLSEQLRQCSIILSKKWLDKQIEFSGDFAPVTISGNKETLQHLWLNLLDNAVKYTPCGGEITVRCFEDGNDAVVSVSDTGEGMDEETMKHLFDPYYQADASHSGQGLGLGLSIVKRIIELYSGSITVESEKSVGSTFTVRLPIEK